jgi:hypothetical protein
MEIHPITVGIVHCSSVFDDGVMKRELKDCWSIMKRTSAWDRTTTEAKIFTLGFRKSR